MRSLQQISSASGIMNSRNRCFLEGVFHSQKTFHVQFLSVRRIILCHNLGYDPWTEYIYICKDDIVKNVSWNVYARKVNWSERRRRDRIKPASRRASK